MTAPVLEARNLRRNFTVPDGFLRRRTVEAVRGVDLIVNKGDITGLVGESGSGKSTMAQMLLGLLKPTGGEVLLEGRPISQLRRRDVARLVQPVFQDPYSSLNPRYSVGDTIGLPLAVHGLAHGAERRRRALAIMDAVGLPRHFFERYPNQLSGGQRQRVAIARALVISPPLLICDEPTSALDVSIQAQILNLLMQLQQEMGLTMLLISHNLAVVEHMTNRMAVMKQGEIVEQADTRQIMSAPSHPYTRQLLDAVLLPDTV